MSFRHLSVGVLPQDYGLSQHTKCSVAPGRLKLSALEEFLVRRSGAPGLTSGAAEAFPLLPPLGIAQDVDDQRGKLAGVEPGQLLAPLRGGNDRGESECTAHYCAVLPSREGVLQYEACSCWLAAARTDSLGRKQTMTSRETVRDCFPPAALDSGSGAIYFLCSSTIQWH